MRGKVGTKQLECVAKLKEHGGKLVYRRVEQERKWINRFGTETVRKTLSTDYVHVHADGTEGDAYSVTTVTGLVNRQIVTGEGFSRRKLSSTKSELLPESVQLLTTHAATPPAGPAETEYTEL